MKSLKVFAFSVFTMIGFVFFANPTNINAQEVNNVNQDTASNVEVVTYGSKTKYHTVRAAKLSGLPTYYVYNDGIYCGQLKLDTWSYEKDFSTGKMWYVGIYKGTVSSGGSCPIARSIQ